MIHFDISKIQLEINELEQKVNAPNFWDNPTMSTPIVTKLKRLKNEVDAFRKLEQELNNIDEMSLLLIDEPDEQMSLEVLEATKKVEKELNELEIKTLLSGKYDQNNAILTLHPAYGYLKGEMGVHRLVRISPFDSGGRRHTSFASLEVLPEISEDIVLDINPDDLRIDTYRASRSRRPTYK